MIVVYHTFYVSGFTTLHAESIGAYIDRLNVGVAIFFVLSGFLIFRPFVHSLLHNSSPPKASSYFLKRAARILPGYWCALFILASVDALTIKNFSGFSRNIFLVHAFTIEGLFSGVTQAWTLTVEMSFYLLVPLFTYLVAVRLKRANSPLPVQTIVRALACIFIGSYIFRLFIHSTHFWFLSTAHIMLPAQMDTIALGMFIAVLVESPENAAKFSKIKNFISGHSGAFVLGSVLVWILSANINMSIGLTKTEFHIELFCHFLYGVSAFLLVSPFCIATPSLLSKVLSFRIFTWFGTISYGVYLWHMAFLSGNFAERHMPYNENDGQVLTRFLVVVPLSIVLATLSYYFLERPIMRLVGRDSRKALSKTFSRGDARDPVAISQTFSIRE
jgi:peptidoglycan/LPS O-acetylase OafA/YrhL